MAIKEYQQRFIELALSQQALSFGEFTLKSGRISPYFFNAGKFCSGSALAQLGRCYADAIVSSGIAFDLLFGPAYKGIPLAAATSVALAEHHNLDVPYAFNRKEAKDHGEGGVFVGAPILGKVLIIDDVITAGTAIREVMDMIPAKRAKVVGVAIGLDRQERGASELSAIQEVERDFGINVLSIVGLEELVAYLRQSDNKEIVNKIEVYREQYGIKTAL